MIQLIKIHRSVIKHTLCLLLTVSCLLGFSANALAAVDIGASEIQTKWKVHYVDNYKGSLEDNTIRVKFHESDITGVTPCSGFLAEYEISDIEATSVGTFGALRISNLKKYPSENCPLQKLDDKFFENLSKVHFFDVSEFTSSQGEKSLALVLNETEEESILAFFKG